MGVAGDKETISTCIRYARQILTIEGSITRPDLGVKETLKSEINFSRKDFIGIHPHENDPKVIIIRCDDW